MLVLLLNRQLFVETQILLGQYGYQWFDASIPLKPWENSKYKKENEQDEYFYLRLSDWKFLGFMGAGIHDKLNYSRAYKKYSEVAIKCKTMEDVIVNITAYILCNKNVCGN